MIKVQCELCGKTGYTASPDYLICRCGGKFKALPENGQRRKVELDEETMRRFDTSEFIK